MARMAVIKDGVTINVIEAGPGFTVPGCTLVESATAGVGDAYVNGTFTRQPTIEPVPSEVTDLQARLALIAAGRLSAVDAAVAQSDEATRAWYDRALTWRRDSPMIAALAPAVGLSEGQIDDLFRVAAAMN